jgi:hypothetical protein
MGCPMPGFPMLTTAVPSRPPSPTTRRRDRAPVGARRRGRLLLGLAGLGFLVYLVPFWDALLAGTHWLVRTREAPLARYLQADHDLATTRAGGPRTVIPAARAEGPRLPQPGVAVDRRPAEPGGPGVGPGPWRRPDLSRSPPER